MKPRIYILLLTLVLSAVATQAQDIRTNDSSIVYLSALDLCPAYNVDRRIFESEQALPKIIDSLRRVQPNAYPIMSQWCRSQRLRISRMMTSLNEDYTREGDNVWMDSTHCITDAGIYISQMQKMTEHLKNKSAEYDRLEQERLEEERKAAEERARAEALRIQRARDQRLAILKDSIRTLHKDITSTCDAKGVADKAKVKELKDLFYAYLSVYNRYDLTDDNTSDNHFAQLGELKAFQCQLIDSVMGPNSLSDRIESFKNTLHARAGKEHTDVNKSYLRVFKKVQIPISFKSIAEYNTYVGQLREIIAVQQSYLDVIELRETIAKNSNSLLNLCGKKQKDVYNSYKDILGELNTIPAYTSLPESEKFIATLSDFIDLQHEYSHAVKRLDTISARGDSIISICPKSASDIATAYKDLVSSTDFIPRFINKASAEYFNSTLDEFERVQRLYISSIGIRNTIDAGTMRINSSKNAPKGLIPGYKQMMHYTDFTPHFNNQNSGEEFIRLLNHFIDIQTKFLDIIDEHNKIENNTKQFRSAFKEYSNINKAYERLFKTYDYELNILSEADLNKYIQHQSAITSMQQKFAELANSLEKEDYNNRLKKVKEPEKIKLIMGVK